MSSLITVYRTPETLQAYELAAYSDMAAALDYLVGTIKGYTGNISADANGNWQLFFQSTSQTGSYSGGINDWVVIKNNSLASIVPASQASSLYTTTPPA